MIIAEEIYKTYGNKVILSGVNIHANKSEIICLIGPSGSGKTTLLKILSLLEHPEKGLIQIGSQSSSFPRNKRIDKVGIYPNLTMVFQQFQLWKHLTVEENILLPVRKILGDRKQLFDELIDILNVGNLLSSYPYQISVGQQQRVAFIRAVLTKPEYLLLDEITSSLDIEHTNKMTLLIRQLANEGTCIIITTHLIGFAKLISDKVYFLDKGMIIENGSSEILSNPKTDRLKQFLAITV
jgi:L-cystine transport system ATP-binding protein